MTLLRRTRLVVRWLSPWPSDARIFAPGLLCLPHISAAIARAKAVRDRGYPSWIESADHPASTAIAHMASNLPKRKVPR